MTKYLKLEVQLQWVRHPGQTVLNVQFEKKAVSEWCLGLCLLKEGLIDTLLIREARANRKIEISLLRDLKSRTKLEGGIESEQGRVQISPGDLDFIMHFFLKYFRDGIGDVNHIDLDVCSEAGETTITFKIPDFCPP